MQLSIDQKDIDKFIMIGDKVLIKPKNPAEPDQVRSVSPAHGAAGEDTKRLYHQGRPRLPAALPERRA